MDLKNIVIREKEVHQAVVLIDNDENFHPLTLSKPKVLMRLVNRPILEYTLDMLAFSDIQEIFVFCSQHYQKIKDFVDNYKQKRNEKINIQIFFSEDYTSLGSVMRDLDSRGLIKSNFILINGDCVGNLKLDELIEKHKQNIKKDPCCVMTCIFRKVSPNHRARLTTNENATLVLDLQKKVVFFEKKSKKIINIPTQLFGGNSSLSIYYNLFDTQISICSEKVPPDFSDNFDYESRENFINGLLADIELLCHHIHAHILENGYAARVDSINAFGNISCDLLQRFVFPIVPDSEDDCSYRRNNVYLQNNVYFSNMFNTMENVAIGKNTSIESEAIISNSVIGNNCSIGDNVKIINSFVSDNVKIQANSSIEKCIIDSNVSVGENCILKRCLISSQVIIDKNIRIEDMKKLYYDSNMESNKSIVGANGCGNEYHCNTDQEDEDSDLDTQYDSDSTRFSDSSEDSCDTLGDEFSSFYNEVYDSLSRGIEENSIAENIILEINSSKHAYNVPVKEVNSLVIKALLNSALNEKGNFLSTLKSNLKYGLPIIKNYIKNYDSQNDCIYVIEEFHLNNKDRVSSLHFIKIIEYLYQENILEEDLILQWFYKPKILPDHDTKEQETIRQSKEIGLFIKWLQEAEEESSSEEDDGCK